jgi:hypothetical protein
VGFILWVIALASVSVASGCAGSGGTFIADDAPTGAEIQRVLLLPMNFDATPPTELARGVEVLDRKLHSYLVGTGRRVSRPALVEVMREWQQLASEVGGFVNDDDKTEVEWDRVEQARCELARRLAIDRLVDAILMPTLLIRQGWYSGIKLRWDGVSRRVPVELEPGSFMETQSIGGEGMGTSLRVTAYTTEGKKFFERFAGLEPIDRFEMGGFGTARGAYVRSYRRTDLFRDAELLEEAIAAGFSPLIAPAEVAAE